MINFAEILKETCGVDENDTPKSFASVSYTYFKNEIETRDINIPIDGGTIDIEGHGVFAQVSIVFDSQENKELIKLWDSLERYGRNMAKYEETKEKGFCTFVFIPRAYEGEYLVTAVSPIFWVLQPQSPQSQEYAVRMCLNQLTSSFYDRISKLDENTLSVP